MNRRIWPIVWAVLGVWAVAAWGQPAGAASYHPFVYGGLQRIFWEKDDLNTLMDPITLKDGSNSWEAGGGLRIRLVLPNGNPSPVAAQARLGFGGGSLPDNRINNGRRFDGQRTFTYSTHETYSYSWWSVTASLSVQAYRGAEFSIGPAVQTVKFHAQRAWSGPSGMPETGNAKDETNVRYGLVVVGARLHPFSMPVALIGSLEPFRARLSTTRILKSNNWTTANFSTFDRSFSLGLEYEF